MSRRIAVAVALTLAAVTAGAREVPREITRAEERASLRALFALAPGVLSDDEHGLMVGPLAVEVVVAQIGPDGKLIKACVDSEAAAIRFLERPVTRNREAQDQ